MMIKNNDARINVISYNIFSKLLLRRKIVLLTDNG